MDFLLLLAILPVVMFLHLSWQLFLISRADRRRTLEGRTYWWEETGEAAPPDVLLRPAQLADDDSLLRAARTSPNEDPARLVRIPKRADDEPA